MFSNGSEAEHFFENECDGCMFDSEPDENWHYECDVREALMDSVMDEGLFPYDMIDGQIHYSCRKKKGLGSLGTVKHEDLTLPSDEPCDMCGEHWDTTYRAAFIGLNENAVSKRVKSGGSMWCNGKTYCPKCSKKKTAELFAR